ncbi:MAG: DUF488 family protein [Victivallaceae bacterium]|jgi:hypothetical protein
MSVNLRLLYRQKVLLALLEVFRGNADSTDFLKLMFLYCSYNKQPHYSFFPYRFGCFSFEIYKDKRILTEKGLLADIDRFSVAQNTGMLYQLNAVERRQMLDFARQLGDIRGDALIRKTYLEFPEYTVKSEIKDRILSTEEQAGLFLIPNDLFKPEPSIYTIGYEGIGIDEYLNKLIKNKIDAVVDVRKSPNSMKFDFNAKALNNFLSKARVEYIGLPDLGIPAEQRQSLDSMADYQALFEAYDRNILPRQMSNVRHIAELIAAGKKVALTCFEAKHTMCHRYRIAVCLNREYGYPIVNL